MQSLQREGADTRSIWLSGVRNLDGGGSTELDLSLSHILDLRQVWPEHRGMMRLRGESCIPADSCFLAYSALY